MIGQVYLKKRLGSLIDTDAFPRFSILVGDKGSGRKTLAHVIADNMNAYEVIPGNSVDSVRDTIVCAYKCDAPTLYVFPDADKMSNAAKNALLKITEEPPMKAYFLLTIENTDNILATLLSRATVFHMDGYSPKDIRVCIAEASDKSFDEKQLALLSRCARNPGQVKDLLAIDTFAFLAFCERVLDNIGNVTGVNALKITNSFKFKEDGEGYDPVLFLNCMIAILSDRSAGPNVFDPTVLNSYLEAMKLCSKTLKDLSLVGVRKDATFDGWVFRMREIFPKEDI